MAPRAHWFGTDQLGRDIFSRVLVATRLDFCIALGAVSLSFVIGSFLGAFAGYRGGLVDRVVSRLADTIMAFPLFVLAMGIVAALGNSVMNIVYATALVNLPFYIRLARAEVAQLREAGFVEAARLSGNGSLQILAYHLYPNALPSLAVQVSLNLGWALLNAAGLLVHRAWHPGSHGGVGHHGGRRRELRGVRTVVDGALPGPRHHDDRTLLQLSRRRSTRPLDPKRRT